MAKRISDAVNQTARVTTNPRAFAASQNQWDRSKGYAPNTVRSSNQEEVSIPKELLKYAYDELCKSKADSHSSNTSEILQALKQYLNK